MALVVCKGVVARRGVSLQQPLQIYVFANELIKDACMFHP
jgi:hypothetical protein